MALRRAGVSVWEEISVLKDLLDPVDLEVQYVLRCLESGTQESQKLIYIKGVFWDNVELDSVKAFCICHNSHILSAEWFLSAATNVPPWLLAFALLQ